MRILGFGAMSFIRRAIKTKKDHPVKPVGIVNRSHLGFSAANFSAGSYNSVAIQQWLFSGSGNCLSDLVWQTTRRAGVLEWATSDPIRPSLGCVLSIGTNSPTCPDHKPAVATVLLPKSCGSFSGSGDCPARPELLAVGEGYTKRLSEPD